MKKSDLNFADNGFDRSLFMEYMEGQFDLTSPFVRGMIDNIIDFAHANRDDVPDEFAEFISDMIPEIDFDEVAAFCDDQMLMSYGQAVKEQFWEDKESESE